ncbi:family 10 glycosylhydrolase [Planctomycetota bacterium]|nr:family 10 glycosylhydrolase [Planctomycetota bacterium]
MLRNLLAATLPIMAVSAVGTASAKVDSTTNFNDYRGLWVTRYEYKYQDADYVDKIMYNAKLMGLNNISFQVRGAGDAYYDSNYESKAISWDALDAAVGSAHGYNMKLHAYINAMPMKEGSSTPNANHIWSQHPEWRLKKADGSTQPLGSGYVTFNPALPEVQQHMANVVSDIATNYDIDGVHLDYIRMIGGAIHDGYMADSTTVNLYRQDYGYPSNQYVNTKSSHYKAWVAAQITKIVDRADDALKAVKPDAELSAATWPDPYVGSSSYQQDSRWWAQHGNVDAVMQMNYSYTMSKFAENFQKYPSADQRQAAHISGIGVYLKDENPDWYPVQDMIDQLNYSKNNGANGYELFSYGDLVNYDGSLNAFGQALRDYNRNLLRERAELSTIESFQNGKGYFKASLTASGSTSGVISGSTEVVNEGHLDQTSQKITLTGSTSGWQIRHLAGKEKLAQAEGNQEFFAEGNIGFWLKTTTADMTVSLLLDDPTTGELGVWKDVIADGSWHLYEWELDDAAQWNALSAPNYGNGEVDFLQVTLDALMFRGSGDAEFYIDTIAHNPFGSLAEIPEPATLSMIMLGGLALLRRRTA